MNTAQATGVTDAELISYAGALAFNRNTNDPVPVLVQSYGASRVAPVHGHYPLVFAVNAPSANPNIDRVQVNAHITDGLPPIITLTTPIELQIGQSFDYMDGVAVTDDIDDPNVLLTQITHSGGVDNTTAGVYIVTYSVTDSDGNTASAQRVYVVND